MTYIKTRSDEDFRTKVNEFCKSKRISIYQIHKGIQMSNRTLLNKALKHGTVKLNPTTVKAIEEFIERKIKDDEQ